MPWSIVQENSGTSTTASGNSVSLPAGTTAGTTLLVAFGRVGTTLTFSGFTADTAASNAVNVYRKTAVAGETSWPYSTVGTVPLAWVVLEVDGLDAAAPVDVKPSTANSAASASVIDTFGSGSDPVSTVYDGLALAVHSAQNTASTVVPTWSGHAQGFAEEFDVGVASATQAASLSVSLRQNDTPTAWDVSATASSAASLLSATHIVYASAGAKRAPMVDAMFGGWIGTAAGLGATSGSSPFDAVTGTPAVVNAGTDAYLELSATAAIENVQWLTGGTFSLYGANNPPVVVVHARVEFPGALPGADLELLDGQTGQLQVRYVSASQKIGVKVGAGTEQLSANAVTADTRYRLELRLTASVSAASIDWAVDGVPQTQATGTTTAGVASPIVFGWSSARTGTVRYRDILISKVSGQYPLGDIRVRPLLVDPAGTVTLSGTTTNFQTFTANGTLAAWNATTARDAVDEIPPTIGASADGFAQVATAAADYVEVPVVTRDAAGNGEAIRAVRWYFCGWAASAVANTVGFRATDGATETTIYTVADPPFDNSTTVPGWVCRMHRVLGASSGPRVWTQTQLDALAARIGFSTDASPAVGVHAVLAEVAMRADLTAQAMFGDAGDPAAVRVDVSRDPDSDGVIGMTTTATEHAGAALHYEVNSTPTDAAVAAGTVRTDGIGAPDHSTVNYVALYPDPEPVTDT